jgi:hypothetical protein
MASTPLPDGIWRLSDPCLDHMPRINTPVPESTRAAAST